MVPLVVVDISDNKWVVAIAGAVLVALMIYSFLELKRSKNVDNKTKFASAFSLIVVIAVIGMLIEKVGR
jgi:hypothetical protein